MTKKKWALLIVCILLLFGYFKLFYKTYSETAVIKTADCIIALDVKRITNTIIWNILTTPSQWKFGTAPAGEEKMGLDDMVKIPDYVFIFHTAGQPLKAWYTVLEINDTDDFAKGLLQYHFEKKDGLYTSKELGIEFIQSGDKLLLGNPAVEDKAYIRQAANELFEKKQYCSKATLQKNIKLASHVAVQIETDDPTNENHFISANFDKEKITVITGLPWKFKANFTVNDFTCSDSSLCTLAFTQPSAAYSNDLHSLLPDSTWAGISKVLNFNVDSLLLPTNNHYQLDIEGIHPRIDSAITYTYDDNFNAVENVVVNTVEEPAFNFTVQGDNVNPIFNYWKNNGKLEQTPAGELFTPVPFVKCYCSKKNEQQLFISSNNYKPSPVKKSVQCILFFKLLFTKIPPSLMKYFPDELMKTTKNIESVEVTVNNEKGAVVVRANFNKKKNDLPIIGW